MKTFIRTASLLDLFIYASVAGAVIAIIVLKLFGGAS